MIKIDTRDTLYIFDLDDTLISDGMDLDKLKKMLLNMRKRAILVVLSNSSKNHVEKQLSFYGLRDYFDAIYWRTYFFHRKPLPSKYKSIFAKYKIRKDKTYAIGDKFITDVLGANLSGIKSILIRDNFKGLDCFVAAAIKPHMIVKDIYSLDLALRKDIYK